MREREEEEEEYMNFDDQPKNEIFKSTTSSQVQPNSISNSSDKIKH